MLPVSETYQARAKEARASARLAVDRQVAAEWVRIATSYARLADLSGRELSFSGGPNSSEVVEDGLRTARRELLKT